MSATSCRITPEENLACYRPDLKKTDSIYETVIVGYRAVITHHYEDWQSYETVLFASLEQAKKYLSTCYTTLPSEN